MINSLCCSRRELLSRLGGGIAGVAFADLLHRNGLLAQSKSPLAPKSPHFPAKAKAVISIFCYGGVSQVDTFDPKPLLLETAGRSNDRRGRSATDDGHARWFDAFAVEVPQTRTMRDGDFRTVPARCRAR